MRWRRQFTGPLGGGAGQAAAEQDQDEAPQRSEGGGLPGHPLHDR
jgi:hypothetical protein